MRIITVPVALVLVVTCTSATLADTGFLDRQITVAGESYRYQVYVPADYTRARLWAVLVDLHGSGAQGNDGIRQTAHFLADQIRLNRVRFPLIVIFPQAARGKTWQGVGMPEMVIAEIDATLREFHTDPDRVYLSGFSMGAAGAYAIASRWPNRFAAMFAIGGLVPRDLGELAEKLRGIPTRLFHGEADERVPVNQSRALVAALKGIGASVRYTEYPATRHGPAAEMAYADPELLEWLLAQRRSSGH